MATPTTGITATGITRNPNDEPNAASSEDQIRALSVVLNGQIEKEVNRVYRVERAGVVLK
jgi:hypothetical protein